MITGKLFQVFVFFLPTQLSLHFWPDFAFVNGIRVDYFAPAIYFVDFLWLLVLSSWFFENKLLFTKTVLNKWTLALLVFALLNIFFSDVPILSLYKWARLIELFSVYLFIRSNKNAIRLIRLPLSLSMFYVLGLAVLQIFNHGAIQGIFYYLGERNFNVNTPGISLTGVFGREVLRPYSTFPHPNALGGFSLVSFFLLRKSKKIAEKTGALCSLILVLMSFSLNALIALPVSFMLFYLLKRVNKLKFKFVVSAVLASFFLTITTLVYPSSLHSEVFERTQLGFLAGKIIAANPVFGAGLGVFPMLVPTLFFFGKAVWNLQPVHNIFLLVTSEIGFIGLLGMVYFILKNLRRENLLPLIAIILTGLFDHYWLTLNQTGTLLFIILGL